MNIVTHVESDVVEIWLTRAEQVDEAVQNDLQTLCEDYATQGKQVVIFYSGRKDLTETTSHHLCYNRKRLAEMETLRERRAV